MTHWLLGAGRKIPVGRSFLADVSEALPGIDGDGWTDHVATAGVADFDPLYACQTDDQLEPEGWHSDPAERYEYRYWDGNAWTDYVSSPSPAQFDPI